LRQVAHPPRWWAGNRCARRSRMCTVRLNRRVGIGHAVVGKLDRTAGRRGVLVGLAQVTDHDEGFTANLHAARDRGLQGRSDVAAAGLAGVSIVDHCSDAAGCNRRIIVVL